MGAFHTYHAPTKVHFSQRIRRLREWGQAHLTGPVQDKYQGQYIAPFEALNGFRYQDD